MPSRVPALGPSGPRTSRYGFHIVTRVERLPTRPLAPSRLINPVLDYTPPGCTKSTLGFHSPGPKYRMGMTPPALIRRIPTQRPFPVSPSLPGRTLARVTHKSTPNALPMDHFSKGRPCPHRPHPPSTQ